MGSPGPAGCLRGHEMCCRFAVDDLRQLRQAAEEYARRAGMPPEQAADFVLALNEITTNAVRHGSPVAVLRLYTSGQAGLVAEVSDRGRWLPRTAGQDLTDSQRGLSLVRRLCEEVTIHATRDGTTVTVRMSLAAATP